MPEIQHSSEANDNLSESRLFNSKLFRAIIFVLLTKGVVLLTEGCAPESRYFKRTDPHRAMTYRNSDGTHGYRKIDILPEDSPGKEFRCVVKPECRKLNKDEEKPEPEDCVDLSKPCIGL